MNAPNQSMTFATSLVIAPMIGVAPAQAGRHAPYPGTRIIKTPHSYQKLVKKLAAVVRQNRVGVVNRASTTLGAKSLGIKIPGNMVIGVFAPKFAVRMLRTSVPAVSRRRCVFLSPNTPTAPQP